MPVRAEERVRDGFHQSYEKTAVADVEFMGGFATWPKDSPFPEKCSSILSNL